MKGESSALARLFKFEGKDGAPMGIKALEDLNRGPILGL